MATFLLSLLISLATVLNALSHSSNLTTSIQSVKLPFGGVEGQVVGAYNNHLFIVGGLSASSLYYYAVIIYDPINEVIISKRRNVTGSHIDWRTKYGAFGGYSQVYTQLGDSLHTISPYGPSGSGGQFNLYNMAAQQSVQKWGDITFPYMTGGKRACMANDGDYLYVVGGYISTGGGKSRMLQMFNLTNMKWEFAQRDQLKRGRINPACVVHPDVNELWVFGGSEVTYSEYYQLPFKFDACPSRTWSDGCGCLDGCQHLEGGMVDGPDIQGIYHGVRAVVFEDFIILIGGSSTWSDAFWPSPNVAITDRIIGMNVHTQKLVEFGQLAYPVAGAAVVRLQGSIYVIGGRTVNHTLVDTIQEITVPIKGTMSPTGSPTLSIEYCCAAVSSKNKKAVRTCPIMETEAQCMKMKNRKMNISLCEWTVCADIGACKYDGVSAGNSRRMRKRCARKQSEDECTAKSGCVWSTGEDAMDAMIDAIDNGHVEEDMVDVKENVLDVEIESDVQEDGYKDLLYTMSGVCTVGLVVLAVYKKRKLSLQSETAGFSFGENEELDKVSVYGSI